MFSFYGISRDRVEEGKEEEKINLCLILHDESEEKNLIQWNFF